MPTRVLPEGAFYYAAIITTDNCDEFRRSLIVIGRTSLFFRVYTMFFSKFQDGYMKDSMEFLKIISSRL